MKSTQRRSSWAEFLGRMAEHRISPHHTSHIIHISPHHTSRIIHISPHHTSHIIHISPLTSHHITSHILHISPHHTSHIHISPHHTSQAESTKKYEFYSEHPVIRTIPDQRKVRELPPKMNIQEVEDPKGRKSTSFVLKTPLRTI